MTKLFSIFCAFICLCVLIAPFAARAEETQKISLCLPMSLFSMPVYVAQAEGFFKAQKLDAEIHDMTNGKVCIDAVALGRADFAFIADTPLSYLSFNNPDVKVIATVVNRFDVSTFARDDKHIRTPDDLRGKRIGYIPATTSYHYLVNLLEGRGMTLKDISPVPLQAPALPQALAGDRIDAFVAWEPWGAQAEKAMDGHVQRWRFPLRYKPYGLVLAGKDILKKPENIKRFLHVLEASEAFIKEHPLAAQKASAERMKMDLATVVRVWPEYNVELGLKKELIEVLTQDAQVIQRDDPNFKDKAIPDFTRFIDARFLRDIAPDRVEKGM